MATPMGSITSALPPKKQERVRQRQLAAQGQGHGRGQRQRLSQKGKGSGAVDKYATNREPFQYEWSRFLNRVKVHELLRVLQKEDKKRRILTSGESEDMQKLVDDTELVGIGENYENLMFMRSLEEEQKLSDELAQRVRRAQTQSDFVSKAAMRLFKSRAKLTPEQLEAILSLCRDTAERRLVQTAYNEKVNREAYLHNATERRQMLYLFLNSHFFNRFLLVLIALSTAIIVLLTFESIEIRYTFPLRIIDALIISVFIVEAVCKIYIYRLDYFRNVWNLVDLSIIVTHFVEICVELVTKLLALNTDINSSLVFRLLKSLRSLRLLRTIKFFPNLQVIVSTIFQSIVSLGSIAILMGIIIIVFAVVGRGLFKEEDPRHFAGIFAACLTLFQLLTLDDWYDLPDDFDRAGNTTSAYTIFIIYLFIYILFEYFVFLNLFVAVLVDNFQLSLEQSQVGHGHGSSHRVITGLARLRQLEEAEEILENRDQAGDQTDTTIGDYYNLNRDSPELKLLGDNMKAMTALDYHYAQLRRRMNLTGLVMDVAVEKKLRNWMHHEERISDRFKPDVDEAALLKPASAKSSKVNTKKPKKSIKPRKSPARKKTVVKK